jgi:3-hydroxyisobutyrate dehydrogenase/2-hydroxy-3-oxopropionate reductase
MGSLMAANLARAGFPLWIYNRNRLRADAVAVETGARVASSPSELARNVQALFTMVSDAQALHDLYFALNGLVEGLQPGTICVEMSTVGPRAVIELEEKLRTAKCHLLDAPVSGSIALARDAGLTVMVGGMAEDLIRVRPMLDAMATSVFHVGPLGSGAAMKLSVNTIIFGLNQAVAEGLVLAESAGISRTVAYDVIESSAVAAPFVHYRRDAFLQERDVPVGFSLHLAQKDLQLIETAGSQNGAFLPQTAVNRQVVSDAIAAGFGAEDVSSVASHLRKVPLRQSQDDTLPPSPHP